MTTSAAAPRSLADDLRGRCDDDLVALLVGRPDLAVPLPNDLTQLAARATTSASTLRALDRLDLWHLQVLETCVVLSALDGTAGVDEVASLLPDATRDQVEPVIAGLHHLALLWGDVDEPRPSGAVREAFGSDPGGLGPSYAELGRQPAADLDRRLAEAPDGARSALAALTWGPPRGSVAAAARTADPDQADSPISWLLATGLLVAVDDTTVVLPRDVALALRGHRLFAAQPLIPHLVVQEADATRVDAAAAGSASELVRRVEDLLELWSLQPPSVLRSGGVGVRDVKAAAKSLDLPESDVVLFTELAWQAGLLARDGEFEESWVPTTGYDAWRLSSVAERWATLARAWLTSTRVIGLLDERDDKDQRRTPLAGDIDRVIAPAVRRSVLLDLADAAGIVPPEVLVAREAWRRPRRGAGGVPPLRDRVVGWTLTEAARLGLTALGALSSFAEPLVRDDASVTPADRLDTLLPRAVDHVLLQADLTAVAPGPLEGDVARELALMADIESTGGATVYRFTEASVRRALDAGRTTSELHSFIAGHSRTPVPQPLDYLIDDVARRHGRLRVGAASSYLRSDDPSVLDELLADRRAELLRLRRVAPTVVVSQVSPDVVLERVRAMNLAPVAESTDGGLLLRRPDARRTSAGQVPPRLVADPTAPRPDVLAAAIRALRAGDRAAARGTTVAGPAGGDAPPRTAVADTVAALRAAVESQQSVWLGYVDDDGGVAERVVDPLEVRGGWLTAFDHRHEAVRTFRVHRISGVAPLDA